MRYVSLPSYSLSSAYEDRDLLSLSCAVAWYAQCTDPRQATTCPACRSQKNLTSAKFVDRALQQMK